MFIAVKRFTVLQSTHCFRHWSNRWSRDTLAGFIYSASKSNKSANLILFTLVIAFIISFVNFLLNSQYYIQLARSLFYACHDLFNKKHLPITGKCFSCLN